MVYSKMTVVYCGSYSSPQKQKDKAGCLSKLFYRIFTIKSAKNIVLVRKNLFSDPASHCHVLILQSTPNKSYTEYLCSLPALLAKLHTTCCISSSSHFAIYCVLLHFRFRRVNIRLKHALGAFRQEENPSFSGEMPSAIYSVFHS